jgi:hypothetical protein
MFFALEKLTDIVDNKLSLRIGARILRLLLHENLNEMFPYFQSFGIRSAKYFDNVIARPTALLGADLASLSRTAKGTLLHSQFQSKADTGGHRIPSSGMMIGLLV